MSRHLVKETNSVFGLIQDNIESMMLEPEMMLSSAAQSIRYLILQGYGPGEIRDNLRYISNNVIKNEKRKLKVNGLYGNFFVFGDLQINDGDWELPPDYVPQDRPWYRAAVDADGEIASTLPYLDARTSDTVISFSCLIKDGEGKRLGIIGIDVSLNRIAEYVAKTRITESGYGVMLMVKERDLIIIAHQERALIGEQFSKLRESDKIAGDLRWGQSVEGVELKNYNNVKVVVFFRPFQYGLYIGLVTPKSEYFDEVKKAGGLLIFIGLALAGVLSAILWRLDVAKSKSEMENRQKSDFLATMSHEIRTPMNAILGITEIQLQDQTLREDIKEALSKIYNSGDLLLGIINDILDFSKIEAGKLELVLIKYDVASLINDIVQLSKIRYETKPIEFKLQVEANVPSILVGDELRIKQILNNLLSNAFKYTEKGEVTLSVCAEYVARGGATHTTLIFHVSDTGQGMTAEQVRKLGDEYARFNLETNRTTQGTGLGMSITQKLIRMMDGDILIKSTLGKGTTVTVSLPQRNTGLAVSGVVGKELAETLQQFRMSSASQMEKTQIIYDPMPYGKVLIVDDVETNLYVAKGLMAPYELSIELSTSGFEVIDKIKSGSVYDIIFMDHMMPKMDGIETTKIIRDLGYTHPIVALTANALVGQDKMFMENGFDGFVSKPIDVRQLNNSLNKLIRDKQPFEVIEEARRQKAERAAGKAVPAAQLPEIFVQDAEKAIETLDAIFKNEFGRDGDWDNFVITVNTMRNSLINIGETELSTHAFKLGQAGQKKDIAVMTAETPVFLNALRELSGKLKSKKGGEKAVEEDTAFLREKLLVVQEACAVSDKKTAKDALIELKRKKWLNRTKETLNTIIEYVMQDNFEEAAALARDCDKAQGEHDASGTASA